MSDPQTLPDTPSPTSSQGSEAGRLRYDWLDGPMTCPFGPVPALASLSPRQALAEGLMTRDTYGPPSGGLSTSAALQQSMESRLRARLDGRGSPEYRLWWVGHALGAGSQGHAGDGDHGDQPGRLDAAATGSAAEAGGTGFWANAIWIPCADGKQRRIEPGTQPLVDGIPRGVVPGCDPGAPGYAENTGEARKMRLYGYGNAIVPQVAAEFIRASMQ